MIARGTRPDGWAGDEPTADTWLASVFPDGAVQPLLVHVGPRSEAPPPSTRDRRELAP